MRPLRAALVAGVMAVVGAGCSSGYGLADAGPSGRPSSTAALQNLAGRVHFMMDESGIPIQNGHIGCAPDAGGRTVTCYGETATTPVDQVKGTFVTSSPVAGPSGCPGTLTVRDGTILVNTVAENPCR